MRKLSEEQIKKIESLVDQVMKLTPLEYSAYEDILYIECCRELCARDGVPFEGAPFFYYTRG